MEVVGFVEVTAITLAAVVETSALTIPPAPELVGLVVQDASRIPTTMSIPASASSLTMLRWNDGRHGFPRQAPNARSALVLSRAVRTFLPIGMRRR
jgi:hypothetical protein